MCVDKKIFLNLCELYPVTAENLKNLSLRRRQHYLKGMEKLDNISMIKVLKKSMRRQVRSMMAKDRLDTEEDQKSDGNTSIRKESFDGYGGGNTLSDQYEEEDQLDQFLTDEEP